MFPFTRFNLFIFFSSLYIYIYIYLSVHIRILCMNRTEIFQRGIMQNARISAITVLYIYIYIYGLIYMYMYICPRVFYVWIERIFQWGIMLVTCRMYASVLLLYMHICPCLYYVWIERESFSEELCRMHASVHIMYYMQYIWTHICICICIFVRILCMNRTDISVRNYACNLQNARISAIIVF